MCLLCAANAFDLKRINCHLSVHSLDHKKCYKKPKVSTGHLNVGFREENTSVEGFLDLSVK